jgi:hypothetical protein
VQTPPPLTLLRHGGREHVFGADRGHQLLAPLACRGDWVARAELAEWRWPDRPAGAARSNLRKVILFADPDDDDALAALEGKSVPLHERDAAGSGTARDVRVIVRLADDPLEVPLQRCRPACGRAPGARR